MIQMLQDSFCFQLWPGWEEAVVGAPPGAGAHSKQTGGTAMRRSTGLMLSMVMFIGLWAAPAVLGEEPRRGGIMNVALAADPPSLDAHQEQTFAVAQPMGPIYNNL